jgi:hypothetical protein
LGKKIVIVGASHGKRLNEILSEMGETTCFVDSPSFRLLNRDMEKLVEVIGDALGESGPDEAAILLNLVDNAFFVARCEDGHCIPPHKDSYGCYHIDGDIACAPLDTAKQLMINLFPILKKYADYPKVLLVPLPRYLYKSCCDDLEHAPNVPASEHVETMIAGLDATHKLWRGIAFREKISLFKICNTSRLLVGKENWGEDPVHPNMDGYRKVANFVMSGFGSLADGGGGIRSSGYKRGREEAETAPTSIPKRPAWVNKSETFATRNDWQGGYSARGGGGGGNGRPYRGFGGGGRGWWKRGNRGYY